MARLRDFLHPLWRDSMYKESPKAELNKAILDSLDTELTETEEETINAKAQSFLGSATDEWLDYWGSWFGLKRDKGQSDEDYRKAIKNHVTHARDTIPALQESIAKFLETNVSNVNIYEPWQDIFLLNDTSHLNGSAHLTSGYYHYAIIDIHISVSFPPEIKEIINWFRPAGVLWMLTYTPGESPNAEIWTMPPFDAHSVARLTELKIMTGFTNDKRGLLSPASMDTGYGLLPFILNDSLLNTKEVLSGLANMGTGFYNYVGTLHGLVEPSNSDTVETLADQVNVINPDEYSKLTDADRDTIDIPVSKFADTANLLDYTYSFDYWNSADSSVYRDTEKYQGKSVMVMTKSRVGISRSQDLNLVKGKEYRVSVYAKTSNNSVGTGVAFNIDSAHSEVHLSDKLTSSWQLYTKTFVYLDGNMKDVAIYPVGNMDGTEVYIAGFMLQEVSNNMLDYSKSLKDINVPVEDNLQYTYVFMDFRKFFYQTMQSEPAVRSSVGFYYTGKEINTYMSKFVDARSLVIDYFAKNLKQSAHSQLMIYNFNLGMWVNYMDENLVVNDVNYSLDFASVEPILNNNGVMAFAIASDIKDEAYTLALDDIHFGVHKLVEYDQGIRMYAEGANSDPIMSPSNTYFTPIIEVNNHQDLIDRYQEHYPIRYIKNIVRSAKIVNPTNLPSSFILNQSNLNGQDFLHVLTGTTSASEDYTLYQYQANVNDTDKAKPRMSISMLGADVQDSVHKDVMANLLDGTMFESRMLPEMTFASQIKNETTLVQVLTDKGPGYEITDPNTTETIVQFTSQATYPETDYIFSLDILQGSSTDTTYNTKPSVSVVVTAESNDWKTAFSDTYTFENASHIEIPVDTEEFFANHFKFTVTLVNNTGLAYMNAIIANPEFKLLMSSTFDGQVIELPVLEVAKLPLIFRTPIRYGDLNTGKDTWKDIRGIISYKDTTWVDDGKEHELVTDLGRVHTDISRLYLQHGADSVENAQYDSVVQTSVDGKHWHTWYDNFQGKRGYVDPYYSEVVNQPRYLSLPVYNTLQDRVDQGKPGYLVNRKVWEEDGQVFDVTNAYTNDFQASSVAERYPIMSLSKLLLGTYASGRTEFKSGNLIDDKYKATKTGWDYNNGGLFVVRSIIYSDTILPLATYKNLVDSGGAGTTQHSRTIEESLDPTGATVTSTTSTTTRKVVNPVDKNQFEVNETDSPLNGQTLLSSNLADFNPHISYPDNPDGTPGFIPVQEKSEIQEQVISYSVLEFLVAQPGVMSLYNLLIAQYPSDLGTAVNTLLRYLMSTHVPVHMELKADVTDATLISWLEANGTLTI